MCGKNMRPLASFSNWQKWHHDFAADPLGLGLPDYSGDLVSKIAGQPTLEEREARIAADRQKKAAMFTSETLRGPAAPEKSAMEIYDAAGVRDRRRRAALMGISQLRTPSGPGTASGGGYSGVGGGLY